MRQIETQTKSEVDKIETGEAAEQSKAEQSLVVF